MKEALKEEKSGEVSQFSASGNILAEHYQPLSGQPTPHLSDHLCKRKA